MRLKQRLLRRWSRPETVYDCWLLDVKREWKIEKQECKGKRCKTLDPLFADYERVHASRGKR